MTGTSVTWGSFKEKVDTCRACTDTRVLYKLCVFQEARPCQGLSLLEELVRTVPGHNNQDAAITATPPHQAWVRLLFAVCL